MAAALLTPADLAATLRLSKASIYRMVSRREVPHVKLAGGALRFRAESITRWIESQEVTSTRAALIAARSGSQEGEKRGPR